MSEAGGRGDMRIVDAWMQHPSKKFLAQPMFDSLRRCARGEFADGEIPIEATLTAMDDAGVRMGMIAAWWDLNPAQCADPRALRLACLQRRAIERGLAPSAQAAQFRRLSVSMLPLPLLMVRYTFRRYALETRKISLCISMCARNIPFILHARPGAFKWNCN